MTIRKTSRYFDTPWAKRRRTTNAYEIARIKKTLRDRTPELKASANGSSGTILNGQAAVLEVTAIAEGDFGYARDGVEVKMHSVMYTIAAYTNGTQSPLAGVDAYLITTKDATAPAYADFIAYVGGTANKNEFMTWRQHCMGDQQSNGVIQNKMKWKYPLQVHYKGSATTDCVKGRTYVVVKNNSGASCDYQISYRTRFTDA